MDTCQSQQAEQRLLLTQTMRQSLEILQMSLPDLRDYIQDQALSNPLLEIEEVYDYLPVEPLVQQDSDRIQTIWRDEGFDNLVVRQINCDERKESDIGSKEDKKAFISELYDQLLGMKWPNTQMKNLCEYLILCLNDRGYLDFNLSELAQELQVPIFDVEQALYIVQSLQPTGVGARTLNECLILQLAQGKNFNAMTLRAAQDGLEFIAKGDIAGLAKLLSCSKKAAQETAAVIQDLNPFPSNGYGDSMPILYQIPEASIHVENGQILLEMNRHFLPSITINDRISNLLRQSSKDEDLQYLKKNIRSAVQLIQCVENRQSTIENLIREILRFQQSFFLAGEPLRAMTMGELAERLRLSISTVSRAVHDKSIIFQGRSIPLRDLFTVKLTSCQEENLSSSTVKRHISHFIQTETPFKPLSDEQLRIALETLGISLSRRTVAKYREELGIPSSSQRRKR